MEGRRGDEKHVDKLVETMKEYKSKGNEQSLSSSNTQTQLQAQTQTQTQTQSQRQWSEDLEQKEDSRLTPTTRVKLSSILTDELPVPIEEKSSPNSQPTSNNSSPKRHYVANTIIASDGEVYQFEPYQLPPPSEIAACFKDWQKSNNASSSSSSSSPTSSTATSPAAAAAAAAAASSSSSTAVTSFTQEQQPHQQPTSVSISSSSTVPTGLSINSTSSSSSSSSGGAGKKSISNRLQKDMNVLRMRRTRADSLSDGANKITANSPYTGDLNESPVHASLPAEWMRKAVIKESTNKGDAIDSTIGKDVSSKEREVPVLGTRGTIEGSDDTTKPKLHKKFNPGEFSITKYLYLEVFGGFTPGSESSQKERKAVKNIANFLAVPMGLEWMIWFGFTACLDTFLYTFTILPLRYIHLYVYSYTHI